MERDWHYGEDCGGRGEVIKIPMENKLKVTLGVIAYNEEKYLPDLLDCILKQSYPAELLEIILVDGKSEDKTYEVMKNFEKKYSQFEKVLVVTNEKRTQPAGWNVVIRYMTGDILIRVDAHALIPENFIENNVRRLESGEVVCGGPRTNIIDENTAWKRTLLTAEQSMFGSGIAPYRRESKDEVKYVKSVFHAAYRKEVIDKVGMFNESLLRTEDNEYHYRIREAGYRICYDESIVSFYQTRNTLKKMIKQKYANGYWIGKTAWICPKCLSLYHFVPGAFVISILATGCLSLVGIKCFFRMLLGLYGCCCGILTLLCFIKERFLLSNLLLEAIFPILHISYGVGTLKGLVEGRCDE